MLTDLEEAKERAWGVEATDVLLELEALDRLLGLVRLYEEKVS
jgi:hypothetical protein